MPAALTDDQRRALLRGDGDLPDLRGAVIIGLLLAGWDAERVRSAPGVELLRRAPDGLTPQVNALLDRSPVAFPLSPGGDAPLTQLALLRTISRHGARHGISGLGIRRLRLTWLADQVRAGVAPAELAQELGVSEHAVRERLRRNAVHVGAASGAARGTQDWGEGVVWEVPTGG